MQHPGHGEIVNETGMRENFIWNIHPLNRLSGKGALVDDLGVEAGVASRSSETSAASSQ
jgi:hypothetical protein